MSIATVYGLMISTAADRYGMWAWGGKIHIAESIQQYCLMGMTAWLTHPYPCALFEQIHPHHQTGKGAAIGFHEGVQCVGLLIQMHVCM